MKKSKSMFLLLMLTFLVLSPMTNFSAYAKESINDDLEDIETALMAARLARKRTERRLEGREKSEEIRSKKRVSLAALKQNDNEEISDEVVTVIKTTLKDPFINLLASSELVSWPELKDRFNKAKQALELFELRYRAEFTSTQPLRAQPLRAQPLQAQPMQARPMPFQFPGQRKPFPMGQPVMPGMPQTGGEEEEEEEEETNTPVMPGARPPAMPSTIPGARPPTAVMLSGATPGAFPTQTMPGSATPGARPTQIMPSGTVPGAFPAQTMPGGTIPGARPIQTMPGGTVPGAQTMPSGAIPGALPAQTMPGGMPLGAPGASSTPQAAEEAEEEAPATIPVGGGMPMA